MLFCTTRIRAFANLLLTFFSETVGSIDVKIDGRPSPVTTTNVTGGVRLKVNA
jgi:hypothetical protein